MTSTRTFVRLRTSDGREGFAEVDADGAHRLAHAPWISEERTGERVDLSLDAATGKIPEPRLLAPVTPSKILCVGRNYRAHAKELGNDVPVEPMLFYKPPSSLLAPSGIVELPPPDVSSRVEHEAELGVVVGRRLRRATLEECAAAIFGLTIVCDVTARDLQKKDGQWWRAKGMDTFCPVGPCIVSGLDAQALAIQCRVDGELRQSGRTSDMIFPVAEVLRHVSRVITLEPGDLVATGTPEGVGPLTDGCRLEIDVEGIGTLRASVSKSIE